MTMTEAKTELLDAMKAAQIAVRNATTPKGVEDYQRALDRLAAAQVRVRELNGVCGFAR